MHKVQGAAAAAAAKSLQSCSTLCNPRDGSPPGSPVPGILQARTMVWVAISFSRGFSPPMDQTRVSYVYLQWEVGSIPLVPPGKLVSYVLLSRKFEKLSGNEESRSKLWFHLITSYLLTLFGVFFSNSRLTRSNFLLKPQGWISTGEQRIGTGQLDRSY